VTFDGSGNPSTGPISGTVWGTRIRLGSSNGVTIPGTSGSNGWTPNFGVVDRGAADKVLRLLSWSGGSGSTPAGAGQYVTTTGLTADINLASNIAGTPVEMRYDAATGYAQWKYTTEGSGAWRNLIQIGDRYYRNTTGNPTSEQTITVADGWWTFVNLNVPARPYYQKLSFHASGRFRSDSNGNDDIFEMEILPTGWSGVNSPGYITDPVRIRPIQSATNYYETLHAHALIIMNPNQTATISVRVKLVSGGGGVVRLIKAWFTAEQTSINV
jgi:hypothetical protein